MCGISGSYPKNLQISNLLKHRGPDFSQTTNFHNLFLSHNLLSIVDYVKQPISDNNNIMVANCEIYNWKYLANKYKITADNDAELLFELLKLNKSTTKLKKILNEINGVYAIGFFWFDKTIKGYLIKDLFGIKPLWYFSDKNNFFFSSERKALPEKIKEKSFDLNPRTILYQDFGKMKPKLIVRKFYEPKVKNIKYNNALKKTELLLLKSVEERIDTEKRIAILVSGGIDSSLLAILASKHKEVICYNAFVNENAEDKKFAELLEKQSNLKFKYVNPTLTEIEESIPDICRIIESSDPVKVSVALPFYFIAKQIKKDNIRIALLGNGADDVFCGYSRFDKNYSLTKDSISKLRKLYDTDNYRDDCIFMNFSIEVRHPYLDEELVKYVLALPSEFKIDDQSRKKILRDIGKKYLPNSISERPKKAAQYGSGFDKILSKITIKNNFKTKSQYLKQFCKENDSSLACLFSGGKDSVLALHIMHNMNYPIKCLITIESENKDSYMYHTPTMSLVDLQAKSMELPLIKISTEGEKEKELNDLEKALKLAKKKYNINGIITGALFSTYQRDRVEIIADKLGLKVFSPLWHKDQYLEVLETINLGIKPVITKIAAYGLDKSYLGKVIDKELLEHLNKLNNKFGFNIAGEGGEYETTVIDAPLFKQPIDLNKLNKKIKEIDQYTAELIIE